MRWIVLAASLLAMTGCVGGVTSVPFPTPAQAAADAAAQQATLQASGLDPAALWENEDLANTAACDQWLIHQSQQAGALQTVGRLGGMASGAVTPFNPLAGFAGQLFSSAISSLASSGTLPYSTATADEIRTAMARYAMAAPAPATLAEAGLLGEGQLYLCTPPGAAGLASKAIATAQVTAAAPAAAMSPAFAASPRRFGAPEVNVNGR